jgi:hypothetical protein
VASKRADEENAWGDGDSVMWGCRWDSCGFRAENPAYSRIASVGAGARMRFSHRILGENTAESCTLSARIPAFSHINYARCMRGFAAKKQAECAELSQSEN